MNIPNHDGLVAAAAGEFVSTRGEGNGTNSSPVSRQWPAEKTPGIDLKKLDFTIGQAQCGHPPIGRKVHSDNLPELAVIAGNRAIGLRFEIPPLRDAIFGGHEQLVAIL